MIESILHWSWTHPSETIAVVAMVVGAEFGWLAYRLYHTK